MPVTHIVAKVLLVNPANKALILRRSASDSRRPLQGDIPGGWVEDDEDFKAAAVRETREEAGIQVDSANIRLVYTKSGMVNDENVCWLFFIGYTEATEVTLSAEHDKADWLSLDEAIAHITYDIQRDFLTYVRDNNLL